jgi:hypothetical protein
MSLWPSTIICLLLLPAVHSQAQQTNVENKPVPIDEVAVPSEEATRKKDWSVTQAYIDVFKILSNENTCSNFYGGPRKAITVLNSLVTRVKSQPLASDVSFQMTGPYWIRDQLTGASYRLFEKTMVNTNGSFYQRRGNPMSKFPSNVGNFAPGSRAARALILLHELGHLIQGEDGDWLIPDDGFDDTQSKANTLRIQQVCSKELNALN